jgi:hypothetical protein
MASKRDEEQAFKRLKETFPGHFVSLDCRHESWVDFPYYIAYVAGKSGKQGIFGQGKTPMEAVDNLIKI